jgi:3-oxoacyl-[acyl-carrier protein] reductase
MRFSELTMRDQVAIVTGGSQGIGRAISLALARHGASVCIADIDLAAGESAANEIEKTGGKSIAVPVDVTNNEQVERMAATAMQAFGRIDVLVNNAGGAGGPGFGIGRVLNITERDWDDTITINLKSVFLCTRAVAPGMVERKRGSIVNMASICGQHPWAGLPAYSAAKAAVINLTRSLAMELAPHVRVNAIAPGLIETPRTSRNRRPEQREQLLSNVPLARMGRPEEVADIAVYLASDVSAWITGTIIDCNGGQAWMTEVGRPKFRDEP